MKLVFVNRFFFPDISATSQILTDLAVHLADRAEVIIITSRQAYGDAKARLAPQETVQGVSVRRIWTSSFGRTGALGRAVDYLTFYLSAFWSLLQFVGRGDVVIAMTDPPMMSMPAALASRIKGGILVNWLHDIFPEVLFELIDSRRPSRLFALLTRARDMSWRAAAANVVLGEKMAEKVIECGVERHKVSVIHNWADGRAIQPIERASHALRREWGLGNSFVVGYSGNMGRAHDLDVLLEAAELLADRDIKFLLIGAGRQKSFLLAEVTRRRLHNVEFRDYQPRSLLGQSLTAPDCHIVSLKPALEGLIVPSKFYGALAAGRPVIFIGDTTGDLPRIISNGKPCGIAVAPNDVGGLQQAITTLADQPDLALAMGIAAREKFDAYFDRTIAMKEWSAILSSLLLQTESK
jgi:glycosyltransferase involved in cell wall biosynthesis